MTVKLTANDGNGHIVGSSIFKYSYSEDVTPLEPTNSAGGTGQVQFSAIAVDDENSDVLHHNSRLMINNKLQLTDTSRGVIELQVKSLSIAGGAVNVTGDTIQSRLNVIKTALPHGGTGANIKTAIDYYCGLVGVVPIYDDGFSAELDDVAVNFIGWTGNVWDHLKMLCSGVSASITDNVGIEMYVSIDELHFRKAGTQIAPLKADLLDTSIIVDTFNAAKQVDIYSYNTSYGTDRVIYDIANYSENTDAENAFKSSISETIQVNAGETLKKRVTIDGSLISINQPVCVETITRTPPSPYAGVTGEYVIVGTDDLPIKPSQWVSLGGKVTLSLTENPNEVEIAITAPPTDSIEKANGTGNGLAPYKIGVESSGGIDYPAFWITGTGVFYNKKLNTFITGASDTYTSNDSSATVDNPFITNNRDLSSRGVAAAQAACGPRISLSQVVAGDYSFGTLVGSTQLLTDNRYRITSASFSEVSADLSSVPFTSFTDFNLAWADDTFANFTETALDPILNPGAALKFNEFTLVPLMDVHTV